MEKPTRDEPRDDVDPERLHRYILQLEEALADYASRFGLTDKARKALISRPDYPPST